MTEEPGPKAHMLAAALSAAMQVRQITVALTYAHAVGQSAEILPRILAAANAGHQGASAVLTILSEGVVRARDVAEQLEKFERDALDQLSKLKGEKE